MKILVVSPHCDDAAFSLAEHILTWVWEGHDVEIFTVYGGIPSQNPGKDKHKRLKAEHRAACDELGLGVTYSCSTWLDDAEEEGQPKLMSLRYSIGAAKVDADIVVRPWGIHHPDHREVARACAYETPNAWIYDEIPYYVDYPREAFHPSVDHEAVKCNLGLFERKKEICRMYRSQITEDVERRLWVPERCWRPV